MPEAGLISNRQYDIRVFGQGSAILDGGTHNGLTERNDRDSDNPEFEKTIQNGNVEITEMKIEGKHIYYDRFDVIREQIFQDTVLKVKTDGKEIPCKVRCNQIESIKINGTIYVGESLLNRELILRYSDGSAKTLTASNYTWNNDNVILSANAGKTNRNIKYLVGRYHKSYISMNKICKSVNAKN